MSSDYCPGKPLGAPYDLTDADWAAIPGLPSVSDESLDGVIDMTVPGEPEIHIPPAVVGFRAAFGDWVKAYALDLNDDQTPEIYLEFETPMTCSNGVVQCRFLVMDSASPRQPLLDTVGHCLTLGARRDENWQSLTMIRVRPDDVLEAETFHFNGRAYAPGTTTELGPLEMKD